MGRGRGESKLRGDKPQQSLLCHTAEESALNPCRYREPPKRFKWGTAPSLTAVWRVGWRQGVELDSCTNAGERGQPKSEEVGWGSEGAN